MELALRFNGEIINGDAMQMYSGLPIVTNQITLEERKGVPHHLLGCVGLEDETWMVGVYRKRALKIIEEIKARGKIPILVGGTHYYTQALLFDNGFIDDTTRADEGTGLNVSEDGNKWPILNDSTENMLAVLREVDPLMAEKWHPNDRRKIRRSLEIWLQHGRKASDIYRDQRAVKPNGTAPLDGDLQGIHTEIVDFKDSTCEGTPQVRFETLILWTHASPDVLNARLDKRVDDMNCNGLLSEVTSMDQFHREQVMKGHLVDKTSGIWVSIGYKEFERYIHALRSGEAESQVLDALKQEAIEQIKTATRQYSKRQVRWIRIKLMHAVIDAGMSDNMFLLDGSDLARWSEMVEQPAVHLSKMFLEGEGLPDPKTLSEAAKNLLMPKREYDMSNRIDLWVKKTCDICATTVVTEDEWTRHVKSRRHKRATKSHDKKVARTLDVDTAHFGGHCNQGNPSSG